VLERGAVILVVLGADAVRRDPQRELPDVRVLRGEEDADVRFESGEDDVVHAQLFQQELE
jgi:hypothetical protein